VNADRGKSARKEGWIPWPLVVLGELRQHPCLPLAHRGLGGGIRQRRRRRSGGASPCTGCLLVASPGGCVGGAG